MKHVSPHRLASAVAGRLSHSESVRIEAHLQGCARCSQARDRIASVRASFAAIRDASPPDRGAEPIAVGVAARAYWETSKARNTARYSARSAALAGGSPWRVRTWIGAGALGLAATLAVVFATGAGSGALLSAARVGARLSAGPTSSTVGAVGAHRSLAAPFPRAAALPPAAALTGVVVMKKGTVELDGMGLAIDAAIVTGSQLVTGDGSLAVQLGPDSGFVLGAHSTLRVVALLDTAIELAVEGVIDLDLAPRRDGQRFEILAGERTVSVRGTVFRVSHTNGALEVACTRGRVVVADRAAEVSVRGGHGVAMGAGQAVAASRPRPLSGPELEVLTRVPVPVLPMWTRIDELRGQSALLSVAASSTESLRVDGVELGEGGVQLRVLSGRHLVERRWARGQWKDAKWVTLPVGSTVELSSDGSAVGSEAAAAAAADAVNAARATGRAARAERSRQLRAGLDTARLRGCLRALTKQGLDEGAYVEFDLGVSATGAITHLNVADTNLPSATASCMRDLVDDVRFGPGEAATFRERLAF